MPDHAGCLSLALQGFLRIVMQEARFAGYTEATTAELAELAGIHPSTADKYLAELRETTVPGTEHQFIQTTTNGRKRRIYPVDQWGNAMPLPDVEDSPGAAARRRLAPPHDGASIASRTMEASRGELRVRKKSNVNVGGAPLENPPMAQAVLPLDVAQGEGEPPGSPQPATDQHVVDTSGTPACAIDQATMPAADQATVPAVEAAGIDPLVELLEALSSDELEARMAELEIERAAWRNRRELFPRLGEKIECRRMLDARKTPLVPRAAGTVAAKPKPVNSPAKLKFETVVGRVNASAGPKQIEDLAQRIAEEFGDYRRISIKTFRGFGEGLRLGLIKPKTIIKAYETAKREARDNPPAFFVWYVKDRSPQWCAHRDRQKVVGRR